MKFHPILAIIAAVSVAQTITSVRAPLQVSGGTLTHLAGDGQIHVPRSYGVTSGYVLTTHGGSADAFWGPARVVDSTRAAHIADTVRHLPVMDSARASKWADSCRFCSALPSDSSRVSGLSDSAKALVRYARTTALHDTADAVRAGNVATATALHTGRTIGATGDVSWTSPAFDGATNVTSTATVQGIRGASVPALSAGLLRYNGSAWGFDGNSYQPLDADLTAIAAFTGTGYAKRTATTPTWSTVAAIPAADVSGLAAVATSGSASDLGAGTLPAARLPQFSGEVRTNSPGSANLYVYQLLGRNLPGDPLIPLSTTVNRFSLVGSSWGWDSANYLPYRDKVDQSTVSVIYASGVTPSPTNHSWLWTKNGQFTQVNGSTQSALGINNVDKLTAQSDGIRIPGIGSGFAKFVSDKFVSGSIAVSDLPASIQTAQSLTAGNVAVGNGSLGLTSSTIPADGPWLPLSGRKRISGWTAFDADVYPTTYVKFSGYDMGQLGIDLRTAFQVSGAATWSFNAPVSFDAPVRFSDRAIFTAQTSGHYTDVTLHAFMSMEATGGIYLDAIPSGSIDGQQITIANNSASNLQVTSGVVRTHSIPAGLSRTYSWDASASIWR